MDVAQRPRAFVRVAGADARDYLQRMVSNDVDALAVGDSCPALLLTAKARLIAPLVVWRRGEDDYLLLTEPELGEPVRAHLTRMRLRASCEVAPEEHETVLAFGGDGIATDFPGAVEVLDAGLEPTLSADELELRRIEAGVPRWGHELDERVLPAEAGLDETHVSFSEGLLPGAGADRSPALPRPCQPQAAGGRARRRDVRRARHELGATPRRLRRRARVRAHQRCLGSSRPRGGRCAPRTTSSRRRIAARSAATACMRWHRTSSSRPKATRAAGGTRTPNAFRPRASRAACRVTTSGGKRSRASACGYTGRSRSARSSGDRALPCGGRGRMFESCRAHGSAVFGGAGGSRRGNSPLVYAEPVSLIVGESGCRPATSRGQADRRGDRRRGAHSSRWRRRQDRSPVASMRTRGDKRCSAVSGCVFSETVVRNADARCYSEILRPEAGNRAGCSAGFPSPLWCASFEGQGPAGGA